ncbi:MAG: hypothetical protein CM1200mP10_26900 [Candidatus Neomarinimicrobiota bacterium]|nr:MAG: hypothetical protein CM1200mP10_26900 [Candidatus Neomarinimicrobiota bacterium]
MPQTMISARLTLPDRLPPEIIAASTSLITSNAFIKLPFSEGVFTKITAPVP